ncbi:MAG: PEGA domain-containing protein, partial [Nitrospinota bacterium]|nr:PEGA domain-containing protein [Nitrospinota bacterium]
MIGRVQKGDNFPIEARKDDWFKILLETGQEGWVFKSLVEVSGKRSIGVVPTAPAKSGSSPYGDSWAIVVGINRYRKPALRLHYAVNDARSVTAALRKIGFPKKNIITLLDGGATARAIRTAFNTLVGKTRSQDRVFIFVAGHGMTLDRPGGGAMGYLLPVEADPANILGTAMPMSEVKDMASLLKAKHVFFAVDACFSGLLAARSVPRAEKRVDAAYLTRGRLRQILTAGERDQPVLEEGGHGLFTRRLLEAMEGEADNSPRDGVLTAMEVAAFVQGRVIASSSSRQTPFFGTMDGVGQFVFTAPGIGDRPPAAPSPPAPSVTVKPPPQVPPPVVSLPKGKADLYVSSDPIGARVFIDGRDTGKETPVLLEGISTGDRRVDTRKGDYMVASTTVSVRRGVINRAKLKLEVLQGRLKVVSEPLEADVFVGKKKVGRTPLIASVSGGPRVIRVVKPGYKPFERKLNISVRRSNRLMAVLVVEPIPPGMVKVPSGWFIMGSNSGGDEEKPRRRVYLDKFFIDKYPVTNVRFRRFGEPAEDQGSKFNGARQPVVGVTW